jgi:Raf kinase inhibitor-like YbhB/YbcL family protein
MRITHPLHRVLRLGLLLAGASLLGACAGLSGSSPATSTGFTLSSPGRADNTLLTQPYAGKNPKNPNCVGENLTPALAWTRAPAGTRSFAIVMDDQAGRAGLGVNHWVAYGIAPTVSGLAEGEASTASSKLVAGKNTLGMPAYLGPCPPRGNAPQHYVYTLIATSLAPDALPPGLSKAELMTALQGKALGAASLVLRYAH